MAADDDYRECFPLLTDNFQICGAVNKRSGKQRLEFQYLKNGKIQDKKEIDCFHTAIIQGTPEDLVNGRMLLATSSENKITDLSPEDRFFAVKSWAQQISEAGHDAFQLLHDLERQAGFTVPLSSKLFTFITQYDQNYAKDHLAYIKDSCYFEGTPHLPCLAANTDFLLHNSSIYNDTDIKHHLKTFIADIFKDYNKTSIQKLLPYTDLLSFALPTMSKQWKTDFVTTLVNTCNDDDNDINIDCIYNKVSQLPTDSLQSPLYHKIGSKLFTNKDLMEQFIEDGLHTDLVKPYDEYLSNAAIEDIDIFKTYHNERAVQTAIAKDPIGMLFVEPQNYFVHGEDAEFDLLLTTIKKECDTDTTDACIKKYAEAIAPIIYSTEPTDEDWDVEMDYVNVDFLKKINEIMPRLLLFVDPYILAEISAQTNDFNLDNYMDAIDTECGKNKRVKTKCYLEKYQNVFEIIDNMDRSEQRDMYESLLDRNIPRKVYFSDTGLLETAVVNKPDIITTLFDDIDRYCTNSETHEKSIPCYKKYYNKLIQVYSYREYSADPEKKLNVDRWDAKFNTDLYNLLLKHAPIQVFWEHEHLDPSSKIVEDPKHPQFRALFDHPSHYIKDDLARSPYAATYPEYKKILTSDNFDALEAAAANPNAIRFPEYSNIYTRIGSHEMCDQIIKNPNLDKAPHLDLLFKEAHNLALNRYSEDYCAGLIARDPRFVYHPDYLKFFDESHPALSKALENPHAVILPEYRSFVSTHSGSFSNVVASAVARNPNAVTLPYYQDLFTSNNSLIANAVAANPNAALNPKFVNIFNQAATERNYSGYPSTAIKESIAANPNAPFFQKYTELFDCEPCLFYIAGNPNAVKLSKFPTLFQSTDKSILFNLAANPAAARLPAYQSLFSNPDTRVRRYIAQNPNAPAFPEYHSIITDQDDRTRLAAATNYSAAFRDDFGTLLTDADDDVKAAAHSTLKLN